jgi:putative ABC transport system permease protein
VPLADIARDAARTTRARPARTLAVGLAVALGIGTIVAVLSMSDAADRQVQARIAALRPELVRLTPHGGAPDGPGPFAPGALARLGAQPGFRSAVIVDTYEQATVRARWGDDAQQAQPAPVLGIEGDLSGATRSEVHGETIDEPTSRVSAHVALVGAGLAGRLGLPHPGAHPTVWIEGLPFRVAGVVASSEYLAATTDAVIVPRSTARRLGRELIGSTAHVRVERGTADAAAEALPLRLTPQHPERWAVEVPRVPLDLAEGISADMRNLAVGMAVLVAFIGVVAIGNAMMRSVYERMPEIGLRRALGARTGHVLCLLVAEAAAIGAIAGALGATLGAGAAVAVALHNGWPATVSLLAVATALPLAAAAGALGGLLPALAAARITPSQALRRE